MINHAIVGHPVLRPFAFLAPKEFSNDLALKYFGFERT
jgi:hypothetical protein